jgi:putative ABC transport system substrate-binding protein
MRRRDFIVGLGSAAAWPFAARAQQPSLPVIGFFRNTQAAGAGVLVESFWKGLGDAGFTEGKNVVALYRFADGEHERIAGMAADLVASNPALIVGNIVTVKAVMAVTKTIPIVFILGTDPVKTGLVTSINRPEGNVTGVVFSSTQLAAKRLGLLHELIPRGDAVAMLRDMTLPASEIEMAEAKETLRDLGREMLPGYASNEREIVEAIAGFISARAGALLVGSGPLFVSHRQALVTQVSRIRLPTIYTSDEFPKVGGLISYGSSQNDAYRRGGLYAARILRGAKPSDLPIEMPTKYDLVINLNTAKALGLTFPATLLALADEVIE